MLKENILPSLSLCLLSTIPLSSCQKQEIAQKPSIIFIYADNLGYGDLGYTGSKLHKTPHIDNIARNGVRLTSLYSSSPVSTPSRASLMTGCYAQRVDMHWGEVDGHVLRPVSPKGLNTTEITIADMLKDQGYQTACIGKWHLGDQPEFLPIHHGFDYFYGIPYSEDMYPRPNRNWPELPLLQNDKVIEAPADLTTTTRRYLEEAIQFMTKNKDEPFFLYFAHNLPGSLVNAVVDERFRGKSANGSWGDAVEEIDWSVGEIIDAVKRLGITEKTLIVFTSDNGAPPARPDSRGEGSNEPFSGPGYTTLEGGMRMPTVAQWPGTIPAGISGNELCTMMDWLPTFAYLAGGKLPGDRIIDGKNIWPLISGEKDARSPHDVFYYYHTNQLQAVREGNWKLHLPWENRGGRGKMQFITKPVLIDLNVDMKEDHDLSEIYPEVVNRLLQHAEKITRELGSPDQQGEEVRPASYVNNPEPLLKNYL